MARLVDEEGQPLTGGQACSYAKAIEALCELLGAGNSDVTMLPSDNIRERPSSNGWVDVAEECDDAIYHNGKLMAVVVMNARGAWYAHAKLHDGRHMFSEGGCSDLTFTPWAATTGMTTGGIVVADLWDQVVEG